MDVRASCPMYPRPTPCFTLHPGGWPPRRRHREASLPGLQVGFGQREALPRGSWPGGQRDGVTASPLSPCFGALWDPSSCSRPLLQGPKSSWDPFSCFLLLPFQAPGRQRLPVVVDFLTSLLGSLNPTCTSVSGPCIQVFSPEPSELLLLPAVILTSTICSKSHLRDV